MDFVDEIVMDFVDEIVTDVEEIIRMQEHGQVPMVSGSLTKLLPMTSREPSESSSRPWPPRVVRRPCQASFVPSPPARKKASEKTW